MTHSFRKAFAFVLFLMASLGATSMAQAGYALATFNNPSSGTVGTAYNQTLTFSGTFGAGPVGNYRDSVNFPASPQPISGSLPPGLSINWNGAQPIVSGTPTQAGSFTVNYEVVDTTYWVISGPINITIAGGTPAPAVTAISPSSGAVSGGTNVTITGTSFTGATSVNFGGTPATGFTVNSPTQISATAPPHASGIVDITVTTAVGTSPTVPADQYTYLAPPTVTSLGTTSGPASGSTVVTITGANFTGATAVRFGASLAPSFTVNSATSITAITPGGSAGTVDVTVTTAVGTSVTSAADQYTYIAAPTVTSVSPTNGPVTGGTSVTIMGTNFSVATQVRFGGSNATGFTVNSATSITATTPAGAAGTVDITVTTAAGTSATSAADQYTYIAAPTVTSLSPTSGVVTGGTSVVINGTNFTGATAVTFGTNAASSFSVNSATQITATAPAGSAGIVDVRVSTSGGTSATGAGDRYTYVAALLVTTTTLPTPVLTQAYAQTVATSGGTAPVTFAVTAGALPAGLSLNTNTGAITGTPTAAGTSSFTLTATDTNAITASRAYSVTIAAALAVTTTSLPTPVLTQAYAQTVATSGGTAPVTFAVTAGALPAGLSLNTSTGAITGTPTVAAAYSFTVTATDANAITASRAYSVTIAAALAVTTTSLPTPVLTQAYAQTVATSGGTAPVTFAVTAGALPAGLSLNTNTGAITGTPTVAGTYSFTMTATDSNAITAARTYGGTIAAALLVTTTTLPRPVLTQAYAQTVATSGGTAPVTFAVTSGTLPAGLSLNGATGAITGTPTVAGDYSFVVTATDANAITAARTYAGTALAPLAITQASVPSGTTGQAYAQSLSGTGGQGSYTFVVVAGALPAGVSLTSAGLLSGTPTAAGTFNFTLALSDGIMPVTTRAFSLVIAPPSVSVTPASFPGATIGAFYSQQVTAAGGTAAYGFAITSGALPPGLSLNANGLLSGTPTASGNFSFRITATDSTTGSGPFTGMRDYTISVTSRATSVLLQVSTQSVIAGGSVTLTASVTPNTATGTITFTDGGAAPHVVFVTGGVGTYVARLIAPGAHVFVATYNGDASNLLSVSAPVSVNVTRPDPSQDPNVRGLVSAEASALARFASSQMTNVQSRLEQLHSENVPAVAMGVSVTGTMTSCVEVPGAANSRCTDRPTSLEKAGPDGAASKSALRGSRFFDDKQPVAAGASSAVNTPVAIWTAGSLMFGRQDISGQQTSNRFSTGGLTAGFDMQAMAGLRTGFAFGFGNDDADIGTDGTRSSGRSVSATGYASWNLTKSFFLDALAGYGGAKFTTTRNFGLTGDMLTGERNGHTLYGSLILTSEQAWDKWKVAPYIRADVTSLQLDAFSEHGAADWTLAFSRAHQSSASLVLGLRGQYDVSVPWGTLSPLARLEYSHVAGGSLFQAMSYVADPTSTYGLSITPVARNNVSGAVGLRASGGNVTGSVEYIRSGALTGETRGQGVKGNLQTKF